MNYPLLSEYIEAIKAAGDNFKELTNLRPVLNDDGQPVMTSGNFAVVFKMKDENTGKFHAVKCFLREQEGRAEAYRQIAEELEYVSSTFLTPIKYLDRELFVDTSNSEESEFPVLLMDWVEGQTLDKYIREHIDDEYELSLLAYQFSRLAMWLLPQPFAHGDLKPDNILVKDDGTLVLVDYDGMYVPAMKGQKAREMGSPDFRHPSRTEADFDEHIDDFSLVSILLSLKAIALQPELLEQYGASDRLLFSEKDYRNLSESQVMDALKAMMQDADLATLYSLFILSFAQNNLSQTSFRLLSLSKPNRPQNNTWTPYDKAYNLKELWEITDPGLYEKIEGLTAEVIAIELSNGNMALRISIPLKNGLTKELKLSPYSELEEGDIILISSITVQEFHKDGYDPIVRYDGKIAMSIEETKEDLTNVWENESVDLGLSVKWARCNLGAKKPEEFGDYFKWGYFVPQNNPSLDKSKKSNLSYNSKYNASSRKKVLDPEDDTATVLLGNSWRMPTIEEFKELKEKCVWKVDDLNGVKGCRVTGSNGNSIFLPFAGCYDVGFPFKADKGVYWSSTAFTDNSLTFDNSWLISFESEHPIINSYYRSCANPIRPVILYNDNFTTEVTEEDLANAWTDEYGVKYSADRKRLLDAPDDLDKYSILNGTKVICEKAFAFSHIKAISFPETISHVGPEAFFCTNLISVNIPRSVVTIDDEAFSNSPDLASIIIPQSVTKIGQGVLSGCNSLSSILVEENNTVYDSRNDCNAIIETATKTLISGCRNTVIPNDIKAIGNNAFLGCGVQLLSIRDSVTIIGRSAFRLNPIKSIRLPNKLKCIGAFCFSSTHLQEVVIPEGVTEIESQAFSCCLNLEKVFIPSSISKIDDTVFYNCPKLKSILVPKGTRKLIEDMLPNYKDIIVEKEEDKILCKVVTDGDLANAWTDEYGVMYSADKKRLLKAPDQNLIHNYLVLYGTRIICNKAFRVSEYLENVIIPSTVTQIGDEAFAHCQWLNYVNLPNSVKSIGVSAFDRCVHLEAINIPNSITQIGDFAFESCALNQFVIPKSVTSLGINPFVGCNKLDNLTCESKYYLVQKQSLFSKDMKILISCICKNDTFLIPSLVNKIGDYAFSKNENLRYITIPDSVSVIGKHAFSMCRELKTIIIKNSNIKMGDSAFFGCYELKRIVIPKGTWNIFADLLPNYKRILLEQ